MRVHKHWLDYDVVALAFLIIGIAAVELYRVPLIRTGAPIGAIRGT